MKRESKTYRTNEVTYTFTHAEVIEALCVVHDIQLPDRPNAYHSYQTFHEPDDTVAIRLRYERREGEHTHDCAQGKSEKP